LVAPRKHGAWLNGHEWANRQATQAGIGWTPLANGFASCDDPAGLQQICDRLGPAQIQEFFDRWMSRLPLPLGPGDRSGGYWWELSMRQIEVSRTLVFDAPRNGRLFFEALVADNLDLGRPEQIELIFGRRVRPSTAGVFATRVVTRWVDVTVNVGYKHSRTKQYFKLRHEVARCGGLAGRRADCCRWRSSGPVLEGPCPP
jgi:hypothetical protein